ncbi:hypothetical protein K4A83_11475 [Spirulina subsalsa FACHB-351]|uniref:Uncharacterized protein n=1 Tax=Spirulina subsalsa FACHB-351 TaxID=234711 RepID=A0ABT3L5V6_9CYAN|nr:hypothetical protein [Spirulina subsalsa]MCW6036878.1 hypothetical protein [Spirulina subsalsa FACHB-351]
MLFALLNRLTETWEQTQTTLNNQAETLKQTLSQQTEVTLNTLTTTKTNLLDNASQTLTQVVNSTEQTKNAIAQSFQEASQLQTALTNALETIFANQFRTLLRTHPKLLWFSHHPLLTLLLLVIVLALAGGLFQAISSVVKTFCLKLFALPGVLVGGLLQLLWKGSRGNNSTHELEALIFDRPRQPEKLEQLLSRLAQLRQEENQLLQEIQQVLMNSDSKQMISRGKS